MAYLVTPGLINPRAVLEALIPFATVNGWTLVHQKSLTTVTLEICLRIPGVTDYIYLWSTGSEIRSRISVGYTSAETAVSQQPNVTPTDCISNLLGSGNYPRTWFFADSNELDIVVLRNDVPAYVHVAVGCLQKYGDYAGGTYADGCYFPPDPTAYMSGRWDYSYTHGLFGYGGVNPGYVRSDMPDNDRTNHFSQFGDRDKVGGANGNLAWSGLGPLREGVSETYSANMTNTTSYLSRVLYAADTNIFSGRHFFHPIEINVRRYGALAYFSPIGYIKNRRFMSLLNYDPEQEVLIAGETWKVFPVARKLPEAGAGPGNYAGPTASGNAGYAIRVVA